MEELSYTLWNKRFAAKSWHFSDNPPILALHGWMDNAASFDNLAPSLTNFHVIAVDQAGHGLSEHRSLDSAYNLWQDVGDMAALILQMKLEPVVLMGHSRGAMIATMLAATFPERVRGLVLLDGFMPQPVTIDETVSQLRRAFDDRERYLLKNPRYYNSYEEAIKSRLKGPLGLSRQAADCIASRALAESEQGFYWRTDPRLRGASEIKLTAEHSLNFVKKLQAPTLLMSAMAKSSFIDWLIGSSELIEVRDVEGGHHFHLEDTSGEVALVISEFLNQLPLARDQR